MYIKANLVQILFSWVMPSASEWEEGSVVLQLLQVWRSKPQGAKHSLISCTRGGLHLCILILALLLGHEGVGPFRPRFRIQKNPCWPAGMAKSNEHQIYPRTGRQFKLLVVALSILIILECIIWATLLLKNVAVWAVLNNQVS